MLLNLAVQAAVYPTCRAARLHRLHAAAQQVLELFNPLPGGWLAFLKFDRQCRVAQFHSWSRLG
jgi:hypothetical protein